MKLPSFSVIIPTYNEENNLKNLLLDIRSQSLQPKEVIIADNNSKDATRAVARKFNARVVKGGLPGPGRNSGARAATGKILVFLDADVRLQSGFFEKAIAEMQQRNLDITTAKNSPLIKPIKYFPVYSILNSYMRVSYALVPVIVGLCIICNRKVFDIIGGFDEDLVVCEDSDFVERAVKRKFKYRVLSSVKIKVSVRRFEEKGYFSTTAKILYTNIYRWITGNYKGNPTRYEWGYKSKQ